MSQSMVDSKFKIKKGDEVQVVAGKDRLKTGKVIRVYPKRGAVLIEKVNLAKRHVRPSQQNPQGGILEKERPIAYSNVLLYCKKCTRGVRVGIKLSPRSRFCKKCKSDLN